MMCRKQVSLVLCGAVLAGLGSAGCSDVDASKKTQGAVIGGVAGAAAGALVAKNERLLGALIGGALGAGGGYLIGGQLEKGDEEERDDAINASNKAQTQPVTAEQARAASTADINGDRYVTMDEVVAMERAGFSDTEMVNRLERTGMFFELTPQQQQYLRDNGVNQYVIDQMQTMNPEARQRAADRLGRTTTRPAPAGSI